LHLSLCCGAQHLIKGNEAALEQRFGSLELDCEDMAASGYARKEKKQEKAAKLLISLRH
jgi:hypothetical protein